MILRLFPADPSGAVIARAAGTLPVDARAYPLDALFVLRAADYTEQAASGASGVGGTAAVTGQLVSVQLGVEAATGGALVAIAGQTLALALGVESATGGARAPVAGLAVSVTLASVVVTGGGGVVAGGPVWFGRYRRRPPPLPVPVAATAFVRPLRVAVTLNAAAVHGGARVPVFALPPLSFGLARVVVLGVQNPTEAEMLDLILAAA